MLTMRWLVKSSATAKSGGPSLDSDLWGNLIVEVLFWSMFAKESREMAEGEQVARSESLT